MLYSTPDVTKENNADHDMQRTEVLWQDESEI